MEFRKISVFFALFAFISVLQINETLSEQIGGANLFLGNITENSVLVHSERVISSDVGAEDVIWGGPYVISFIEAYDVSNSSLPAFIRSIYGGLNQKYVTIRLEGQYPGFHIDFQVNIYAEPATSNDFVEGNRNENSSLIHSERITEDINGNANFSWSGTYHIHMIEGLDQSNGSGGYVYYVVGGVNQSEVIVHLRSLAINGTIDFIFNLYGRHFPPNDLIIGEATPNSILVHQERVITTDHARVNWTGLYNITRIEALDQRSGAGGNITLEFAGVNFRAVELIITAYGGRLTDYIVSIYAEPATANNWQQGYRTNTSVVMHSERLQTVGTGYFSTQMMSPIVFIEALDQLNGTGGFPYIAVHGVGVRTIYIGFTSENYIKPIDFIINVYTEPLTPRNWIAGNLTANSQLLHREIIIERQGGLAFFEWSGNHNITRIEALDQSIGDGGEVYQVEGGLNETFVRLYLGSVLFGRPIDFIIYVYGEL